MKTQEKQYRIIEPIKNENGKWTLEKGTPCSEYENTLSVSYMEEVKGFWPEINYITIGKIGDIVPFSQLEKWIEQGLHPIYFTEEVNEEFELAKSILKLHLKEKHMNPRIFYVETKEQSDYLKELESETNKE